MPTIDSDELPEEEIGQDVAIHDAGISCEARDILPMKEAFESIPTSGGL